MFNNIRRTKNHVIYLLIYFFIYLFICSFVHLFCYLFSVGIVIKLSIFLHYIPNFYLILVLLFFLNLTTYITNKEE